MTEQTPTGVFVRLPLTNAEKMALTYGVKWGGDLEAGLIAIGMLVTDGDVKVVAYDNIASGYLSRVEPCTPSINLVRQTDHLAKLAERDAEIARLQTQNEEEICKVIEERDECEQVINDLYQAVIGDPPEWSNSFGYRDAVEDVVDYVHALRIKALKGPEA